MNQKNKFIVLADGQGSLFAHILKSCQTGHLNGEVLALVSSKLKAPVLEKAQNHQVPSHTLPLSHFASFSDWDKALGSSLTQIATPHTDTCWVVLAGFLKKIGPYTLSLFKNRIINIHPSLLPKHGGEGMYGIHVHKAVIKAGDTNTGISIHYVSEQYDQGPLIAQMEIPVSSTDTPQSLQKKVKTKEPAFYVATLNKVFKP